MLVITEAATPSGKGSGTVMFNLLQRFRRDEMLVVCGYYLHGPRITWDSQWPRRLWGICRVPGHWRGERWLRRLQWPFLLVLSLLAALVSRCQVVLAVYPGDGFLLVGYLVSVLTGRPLLPYFHNTYLEASPTGGLARWLQPRVLRRAKDVVVISEGMKRLFAVRYPGLRCHVLTHSHNFAVPDPVQFTPPPIHAPVRLVMIGNINATNQDAATRFFRTIGKRRDCTLSVFTTQPARSLTSFGFDVDRMYLRRVPYDSLITQITEHDIVLHPHGITANVSDVERQTIFPTRTIEYLLSCRPILAHVPADSYIAEFYRQHDCALVVSQADPDALCAALDRLMSDSVLRTTLARNALRAAQMFRAERVSRFLRTLMQKAVQEAEGRP